MRLIDANRLEEAFAKECTAECPICSYYKSDAEVDVECHCGLINNAPTVEQPTGEWIEVKTRPCTDEEFEEYKRLFGDDIERKEFPCFICPMPSDGDEILICTSWGVDKDKCEYDTDYGYGLEERGDWEGVIAWMLLPEPYKKGEEE